MNKLHENKRFNEKQKNTITKIKLNDCPINQQIKFQLFFFKNHDSSFSKFHTNNKKTQLISTFFREKKSIK